MKRLHNFLIYKITNKINKKSYIGLTTRTIKERWKDHCRGAKDLLSRSKKLSYLQKAIIKYKPRNFKIKVIDSCNNFIFLNKMEQFYIKKHKTLCPNGYNLTTGGKQYRFTKEHKKYLSLIRKGTQSGLKNNFYGKKHTIKSRLKMSKTRKNLISSGKIIFSHNKCAKKTKEIIRDKAIWRYLKKTGLTYKEYRKEYIRKHKRMSSLEVSRFLSHIRKGNLNPAAKKYILISPNKKIIKIHGNFLCILKNHNLSEYAMRRVLQNKITN
jgi:group I intron endonuclease